MSIEMISFGRPIFKRRPYAMIHLEEISWTDMNVLNTSFGHLRDDYVSMSTGFLHKNTVRPPYMACSMVNRTGSGLHVSDLLEILRIDRLT